MLFSSTISSSLLLASLVSSALAHDDSERIEYGKRGMRRVGRRGMRLIPRKYTIECDRSEDDKALIKTEFNNAAAMAAFAAANLESTNAETYTSKFVPTDLWQFVKEQLKDEYGRVDAMKNDVPTGDGKKYELKVTCNAEDGFCKKGYYASMSDKNNAMNICPAFWDVAGTPAEEKGNPNLISTADIIAKCKGDDPKYKTLVDIRLGRAQTLLHEFTHTKFFMGASEKTIDYAYGPKYCLDLAAGVRRMPKSREYKDGAKKTKPYCPDPNDPTKPGICDKNLAIDNADTLAIIAGGIWYSDSAQCNRLLPIGATADDSAILALIASTIKGPLRGMIGAINAAKLLTESATIIDPPWTGIGFDAGSCDHPDENGCCGDCTLTAEAPKPKVKKCFCNESRCTAEPAGADAGCCANGTCGPDVPVENL